MTAARTADSAAARTQSAPTATITSTRDRKPWKKRTPVDVVLDQIEKAREDAAKKEEEYKVARRQFDKLEAARKVLEGT